MRSTTQGEPGSPDTEAADQYRDRLAYELDRLPGEIASTIQWFMDEERKVNRAELADLMGVTRGRVTQILSGDENVTLHTLAAVCAALDAHFEVRLVANDEEPAPEPGTHTTSQPPAPPRRRQRV